MFFTVTKYFWQPPSKINFLRLTAITENITIDLDTMKEFLKNSDSGRFFQKQKGNIITDFTHTNLMDIGMILT